MATVNVSNWAEFKAAIAVSGDTVVLPESAVWDLNEIEPSGTAALTIACAEIDGNGTEIRNMWSLGGITQSSSGSVNDLKITNIVAKNNGTTTWMNIGGSTWERCTISGIFESGFTSPIGGNGSGQLNFCSMHTDMSAAGTLTIASGARMTACRITLSAPNATNIYTSLSGSSGVTAQNCEFVISTQGTGTLYTNTWESCTLRGAMPHISTIFGLGNQGVSIYCSDDVNPSVSVIGLTGVTDDQMKSAAYLQGIGFTVRAG